MDDAAIKRLRALAERARETDTAYRALPSDAHGVDVMRLGYARNSALCAHEKAASPDVLLALLDEREATMRERDIAREDYAQTCRLVALMHGAATGQPGCGPKRGVVEDVEDMRAKSDAAMALLRECRTLLGRVAPARLSDAEWRRDLTESIDALLLGDGGEGNA